ncbi:uncharacterized protein [Henckelia pumila]|uniref:uncharacterized protein n=1 Tax=Henckelia pumila TaxID=405737 RepID=UPI003C6DDE6F
MEDGFEKLDEKEGDKMQVENEVENEPKKIVDDVIVDSIKMTSKDDGEASGRNIDDRVSKLLVDESDAASGFDPKKIVNIRKKVEHASRSNKESWMNVPRRVSKRLREKSSSLVGSTIEDDYLVDLDRVVEQVTLDVGQVVEDPLQVYKGRTDFCGHDLVTDSERKAITSFLSREKLDCVVWNDSYLSVEGPQLCDLLFGNDVRGEITECYLKILCRSNNHDLPIYTVQPWVQRDVLKVLGEHYKNKSLEDHQYVDFLSKCTKSTVVKLHDLNKEVMMICRYVLFPIGVRSHWFLLVWNNEKKEFVVRNSIDSSYDRTSARQFVEFLLGYLRLFKDLDLSNCTVGFPNCRVQGPNPDCGVFTCLWAKCYARDDPFTWNHQTDCKIDGIRAYVAAAILSDEYGLSKMS